MLPEFATNKKTRVSAIDVELCSEGHDRARRTRSAAIASERPSVRRARGACRVPHRKSSPGLMDDYDLDDTTGLPHRSEGLC